VPMLTQEFKKVLAG